MRPANQQKAIRHMEYLISRKLSGNRQTRVKEQTRRANQIAVSIWQRYQVGPYQYQLKHLRWYLETQTKHLKSATRYRHWLTIRNILTALGKQDGWLGHLQGPWIKHQN